MISLTPPNGDHFDEFIGLAEARPPLSSLRIEIKSRYRRYESNQGRLERVATVDRFPAVENAFKSGYTTLRNRLNKEMNDAVAEAQVCPYCLIEYARDWDHFLPQKRFPDFAVYRPNLIRVCTRCNRMKGNRLVARPRKALNPYFDPIDTIPFLKCDIDTSHPLTAIFQVDPPAGTDPYIANLIREHFKAYGLARKYRAQATDQLTKFVRAIRYEASRGVRLTQTLIHREATRLMYIEDLAPNHWQLALARALCVTPGLRDYIRHQIGTISASHVA